MTHLVQFSTGAGSAEVLYRVAALYGADNTVAMTADTLAEDEDNWRFAREVIRDVGCRWEILAAGQTPMGIGRKLRVIPNNRMAVCSRVLKREILRKHMEANYDPAECVVHLGFDWTEEHRLIAATPHWEPWTIAAPLCDPPYVTKAEILDGLRARGIQPPRLYAAGFSHANCGGACVRGGQAQWALLLRVNRTRYLEWEAEEESLRAELGDHAILRERTDGQAKPLPLRKFRERLDTQPTLFDRDEWGACGCFMDEGEA